MGKIDFGGNKIGSLISVTYSDFNHVRQGKIVMVLILIGVKDLFTQNE